MYTPLTPTALPESPSNLKQRATSKSAARFTLGVTVYQSLTTSPSTQISGLFEPLWKALEFGHLLASVESRGPSGSVYGAQFVAQDSMVSYKDVVSLSLKFSKGRPNVGWKKANFRNLCHLRSWALTKNLPGRICEGPVIVLAEQVRTSVLCCGTWANTLSCVMDQSFLSDHVLVSVIEQHRTVGRYEIQCYNRITTAVVVSGTSVRDGQREHTGVTHISYRTAHWRACLEVLHPCL